MHIWNNDGIIIMWVFHPGNFPQISSPLTAEREYRLMRYSVGIETRKKILSAAKQLFIEKGYTATTFTDICKAAEIKQGSLTYHFKNKLEIGQIINSELLRDSICLSNSLTKDTDDPFYHFSMNIVCFSYQYFHDSAFQRFTAEFALESMKYDINEYVEYYMIRQNLPVPEELLTTKRGKLDLISVVYLDNIIPAYLRSHMDEFNYEESALYMLEMYNKILFDDDQTFNNDIKRAISVFHSYLATQEKSGEEACYMQEKLDYYSILERKAGNTERKNKC